MARVVTVNDVLDGHVVLDIECLDRIYLNAWPCQPQVAPLFSFDSAPPSVAQG